VKKLPEKFNPETVIVIAIGVLERPYLRYLALNMG